MRSYATQMSKETQRNTVSDKTEVRNDIFKKKLAYPASRATAALELWKREMLLYLGGKELSQVAEDVGELADMPDKRAMPQGCWQAHCWRLGGAFTCNPQP